jgi:enterobactin synthetase component D
MSLFHRPACLTHLHREELATGLVRVGCHYAPERLCDDSFAQADIPLPPSLSTAVA